MGGSELLGIMIVFTGRTLAFAVIKETEVAVSSCTFLRYTAAP